MTATLLQKIRDIDADSGINSLLTSTVKTLHRLDKPEALNALADSHDLLRRLLDIETGGAWGHYVDYGTFDDSAIIESVSECATRFATAENESQDVSVSDLRLLTQCVGKVILSKYAQSLGGAPVKDRESSLVFDICQAVYCDRSVGSWSNARKSANTLLYMLHSLLTYSTQTQQWPFSDPGTIVDEPVEDKDAAYTKFVVNGHIKTRALQRFGDCLLGNLMQLVSDDDEVEELTKLHLQSAVAYVLYGGQRSGDPTLELRNTNSVVGLNYSGLLRAIRNASFVDYLWRCIGNMTEAFNTPGMPYFVPENVKRSYVELFNSLDLSIRHFGINKPCALPVSVRSRLIPRKSTQTAEQLRLQMTIAFAKKNLCEPLDLRFVLALLESTPLGRGVSQSGRHSLCNDPQTTMSRFTYPGPMKR